MIIIHIRNYNRRNIILKVNSSIKQSSKRIQMTFISRSPKYPPVYKSTLKQMGRIGPGSYNPYKQKKYVNKTSSVGSQKQNVDAKISLSTKVHQTNTQSLLGPGKYQIQCKLLTKSNSSGCQSVFKSKLDRFTKPDKTSTQNQLKQPQKLNIYQYLLERNEKKNLGKLYGIERDRNNLTQSIPSIPTNQQSYGYRIDPKTKKLVQNQNPKIILAKRTLTNSIDPRFFSTNSVYKSGPGSYFLDNINQKNIKCLKWYKSRQKNLYQQAPSLEKQTEYINLQEHNSKNWISKGNILTSKQDRINYHLFHSPQEKIKNRKQQLVMNLIRKKYSDFIRGYEIRQIIQNKEEYIRRKIENESSDTVRESCQVQCFGSMQKRLDCHHQNQFNPRPNEILNLPNPDSVNNNQKSIISQNAKKIPPFGSRCQRFYEQQKQNNRRLGPGSYNSNSSCFPIPNQHKKQKKNKIQLSIQQNCGNPTNSIQKQNILIDGGCSIVNSGFDIKLTPTFQHQTKLQRNNTEGSQEISICFK